jgi:transcriptional regulator with XRE-family HTH domain
MSAGQLVPGRPQRGAGCCVHERKSVRTFHVHEVLAKRVGLSRPTVSRLENDHSSDLGDVIKILDALGVDGDQWQQIVDITRQASERGWWESARGMGERQARYADLEAGAARIREYQQIFVPGLLQTPEFVRARIAADTTLEPLKGTVDGVLEGNAGRQRMLRQPGAPSYEVIIDELAIRRRAAPAEAASDRNFLRACAGLTALPAPGLPASRAQTGKVSHRGA